MKKIFILICGLTMLQGCNASGIAAGMADGMSGRSSYYSPNRSNTRQRVQEIEQGFSSMCRNSGSVYIRGLGCT